MSDDTTSEDPASFFTRPADDVLGRLGTDAGRGLDAGEASRRLDEHGRNEIAKGEKTSAWVILLEQFKSIVILILVAAGVLAAAFQEWPETIAVAIVVLVNTAIGFFSEWKALKTMEALQQLGETKARVLREGEEKEIASAELVPGDILVISGGDLVPADARVIETEDLRVDESALTGESVPVDKSSHQLEDADAPLAERSCLVFKGTTVADGDARAVVIATGMDTELGNIARQTEEAESGDTPLQKQLDALGRRLAWITVVLAAIVAALGLIAGEDTRRVIETSLALGVAAIPEGLPIVATIALARGMWLMAKRNAVVNKLTAVETLGATQVILSDKTGTLTQNEMAVSKLTLADGEELSDLSDQSELPEAARHLLEVGLLCNNADLDKGSGDPMEIALLAAGQDAGISRADLLEEMPELREVGFDRETMMMATLHRAAEGKVRYAVKGAPAAVIASCSELGTDGEEKWNDRSEKLAAQGLRVLAFAQKEAGSEDEEPYENLTLLGLVGLLDPPREDVGEALEKCRNAGIRVVMVTGDQTETARAIAAKLKLSEAGDGSDLEAHTGRELKEEKEKGGEGGSKLVERTAVFARVTPEQKLDLVGAFQDRGDTVAMTGDGVNDAPALKKADIGIAMGKRGTDAARQAAEMVLRDDAFSSIVAAIEQGRVIFGNIRKSVLFMLCTNVAEIIAVAIGSVAPIPIPLTAMQILFLNMLTDVFPALALGVGKGSPTIMDDPPRPSDERILTRSHWIAIACWAFLLAAVVLGALVIATGPLGMDPTAATTISFLTLGFAKLWFVFNLRDRDSSIFRNAVVSNPWIWASLAVCATLLVAALYLPGVSDVLPAQPISLAAWGTVLGMSLVPVVVGQIYLFVRRK